MAKGETKDMEGSWGVGMRRVKGRGMEGGSSVNYILATKCH